MKHLRVLVIGGSGFIGRHLVNQLVADGRNVLLPTRRIARARPLLPLPTVRAVEADVHDDAALDQLVRGQDAVINLVGILHGDRGTPYGEAFRRAHVTLPARIARTCAAHGVGRLIHMSALGADPAGASMYQRSRGDGENAVRQAYAALPGGALTLFRPSVVFGPEDRFLNLFARLARIAPCIPLAGSQARIQPIYVGDVARALARALDDPRTAGRTYALAGPQVYTLRELVERACAWSGRPRRVLPLPMALGRLQAGLMEYLPGPTLLSRDNLDSLRRDNVLDEPMAPELDIHPTPLDTIAPHYLSGRHPRTRFDGLRTRHGRDS